MKAKVIEEKVKKESEFMSFLKAFFNPDEEENDNLGELLENSELDEKDKEELFNTIKAVERQEAMFVKNQITSKKTKKKIDVNRTPLEGGFKKQEKGRERE